jgi:hypothetical protein
MKPLVTFIREVSIAPNACPPAARQNRQISPRRSMEKSPNRHRIHMLDARIRKKCWTREYYRNIVRYICGTANHFD